MPKRILHLASSLGPTASGRAISRFVPTLPRNRIESLVVNLGESLHSVAGVTTFFHRLRYRVDVKRLWSVWHAMREFQPDVVHAWGERALIVASLMKPKRLIISHVEHVENRLSRWLLCRVDRTLSPASFLGIDPIASFEQAAIRQLFGISGDEFLIVASGSFDANAQLLEAVWAYDVLRHANPQCRLILLGDGPKRQDVERFAKTVSIPPSWIHFAGIRANAESIIASADAVWLTHRRGGLTVGLEAVVNGVPVFGYRTADTGTLPANGSTLVSANDPVALAKATHRRIVTPMPFDPPRIPVAPLATALADVYDDVTNH